MVINKNSRVAQWKRAGPITQRSVDRNYALLKFFFSFRLTLYKTSELFCLIAPTYDRITEIKHSTTFNFHKSEIMIFREQVRALEVLYHRQLKAKQAENHYKVGQILHEKFI